LGVEVENGMPGKGPTIECLWVAPALPGKPSCSAGGFDAALVCMTAY